MSSEDEPLLFTTAVDAERCGRVRRDVARAMIVQNARIAKRWDPAAKVRTSRFEGCLTQIGLGFSIMGAGLMLLFMAIEGPHYQSVGMLLFFLSAILLLVFVPRVRKRILKGVDRSLVRTAGRLVAKVEKRLPAVVGYELDGLRCRCRWSHEEQELASWDKDLSRTPYGLVGDAGIVLFASAKRQSPQVILFDTSDELRSALADLGIELEVIDEELLPDTTSERSFEEVPR